MRDGFIVSEAGILGGKPHVRDTRLSVEFLLKLTASAATLADIVALYPQLTIDGPGAAYRYAADVMRGEHTWVVRILG